MHSAEPAYRSAQASASASPCHSSSARSLSNVITYSFLSLSYSLCSNPRTSICSSTELIHLDSLQHSTSTVTSILTFLNHSLEDLRANTRPPTDPFPNFGKNIRSHSTLPCTFSFFSPPFQVLRKALDYFCGCKCVHIRPISLVSRRFKPRSFGPKLLFKAKSRLCDIDRFRNFNLNSGI